MKKHPQEEPQKKLDKITVKKGEFITWDQENDWLEQFKQHLDVYMQMKRHKSKAHRKLAESLTSIVNAKLDDNKTIRNKLWFNLCTEFSPDTPTKKRLIKSGRWNRRKSYLYTLCLKAYLEYPQALARENNQLQRELEANRLETTNSREQSKANKALTRKNEQLIAKNERLENEAASSREQIRGLQNRLREISEEKDSKIEEFQQEIARLNESLLASQARLEEKMKETPPLEREQEYLTTIQKLEGSNKQLRSANREYKEKDKNYEQSAATFREVKKRYKEFEARAHKAESELASLRNDHDLITNFIERVFGATVHNTRIIQYIKEKGVELILSATKIRLIREITFAEKVAPELEDKVAITAEKIRAGENVATLEDTVKGKFTSTVNLLSSSITQVTRPSIEGKKLLQNPFDLSKVSLPNFGRNSTTNS